MVLPIDPTKIKKAADEVLEEIESNICVNVYIDPTANPKFIESIQAHLELTDDYVTVNYVDISSRVLRMDLDPAFAIILAGSDKYTVLTYQALQVKGVPALIVCLDPHYIVNAATAAGVEVRKSDVICPAIKLYT